MLKWLIGIGLIVYVLAEIALLVEAGRLFGLGWMLAWTIASALLGLWLLRVEGIRGILRIHRQLQQEILPTRELIDMALIVVGAMLLVAPGILSDAMGILLLFPPTRMAFRALVRAALGIHSTRERDGSVPPSREVIDVRAEHVQD
ncbi:MAG TPA: FxsA family protein [bacterium]